MALITINLTGLELAIAAGQGRIATDPYWLPITLATYNSLGKQTPPDFMPQVDMTGSGRQKLARKVGTVDLNGYYREFKVAFPASNAGASQKLSGAFFDYLGTGGDVTVYGLDPYLQDTVSSTGRVYQYCYWDGLIKVASTKDIARFAGGYDLILDCYRMTRRIP